MSIFQSRPLTAADVPAGSYAVYEPVTKHRDDGTTRVVYFRVSQPMTLIDAALWWNNHPRWARGAPALAVRRARTTPRPSADLTPHIARRKAEEMAARKVTP